MEVNRDVDMGEARGVVAPAPPPLCTNFVAKYLRKKTNMAQSSPHLGAKKPSGSPLPPPGGGRIYVPEDKSNNVKKITKENQQDTYDF